MFEQVYAFLVIHEFNLRPLHFLLAVLFLFHSEHVLVELLLKFLIGIVDAKLLKGILFEDLKAKDIQETDEFELGGGLSLHLFRNGTIYALDKPVEKFSIDDLSHPIPGGVGFFEFERGFKSLFADYLLPSGETFTNEDLV